MLPTEFTFTPLDDITRMRDELKQGFASGKTRDIAFRKTQLLKLAYMIKDHMQEFVEAMALDLGRNELETDFLDVQPTLHEIMEAYHNVSKWSQLEKVKMSYNWFAMSPTIRKVPKGTVLIISPFNFPIFLTLGPLAGALAAGCTAMLKPSELSPNVSNLIATLVPQYLDHDVCQVVKGGVPESTKVLELQWDHILYTGSGRVAKIVLAAAAKHLTPVTTELGGKNPVIIDPKADMKLAARRILWGKVANCGQTCTAPDYVLVPSEVEEEFIKELLEVHASFYPESPRESISYSRMATKPHAERMRRLIGETKGKILIGGETDVEERFVAPTIVRVTPNDALMQEELFGPILAVVPVKGVDEAIQMVNSRDHPLALYVFTNDQRFKEKVYDNTQSGAAVANETVIHVSTAGLPFGGIGPSGSGPTTGKYSFDMFTHQRASLEGRGWLDRFVLFGRFPPYNDTKFKSLAALGVTKFPSRPKDLAPPSPSSTQSDQAKRWSFWFIAFALAAVSAAIKLTPSRYLIAGQ